MKNLIHILLVIPFLIVACVNMSDSNSDDNEDDETEELTEFGKLINDKFEEVEFPYESNVNFDNYEPDNFLSEDDFQLLELYMVFIDGFKEDRYCAEDRIELESGVTLLTVTFENNENELSTYLVTYNDEEWYVSNVRTAYDNNNFLKFYSTVNADTIIRTMAISLDEVMYEVEHYYIQEDGSIIWEEDMIQ